MITVGERIRERRQELNLTQSELAERAGVADKTAISRIEHAGNDITMRQIRKLAPALETTQAYLMGWENPDESEKEQKPAEEPNIDLMRKALELYNEYANASPEVRTAVELLLKSSRSDS